MIRVIAETVLGQRVTDVFATRAAAEERARAIRREGLQVGMVRFAPQALREVTVEELEGD